MNGPLFAMPEPRHLRTNFLLCGLFVLVFVVFYGGASFASGFMPYRLHVDFAFERSIPFVPAAAWVYVSMDLLLMLAPFVLRTPRAFMPLFFALCAETILSVPFFVALPVETSFPTRVVADGSAAVFAFADTLNLERNFFPSLHVAFSFTAAFAYAPRTRSLLARSGLYLWALGIAISTMLIHEHHLIDVLAGLVVALCATRWVTEPLSRESAQESIAIEGIMLREMYLFGKRHARYWWIAVLVLLGSLPHFRRRRALRSGYVFLQLVDDLLDGDRAYAGEPLELIDAVLAEIHSNDYGTSALSRVARAYMRDLAELNTPDDLVATSLKLVRVMQRDRVRARDRRVFDAHSLREHHRATFTHSLDVLLAALESPLRGANVPALVDAFAWASTARDLKQDLEHGLVNIPREVLEPAGLLPHLTHVDALLSAGAVNHWLAEQASAAEAQTERALELLAQLPNERGNRTLKVFARSIRKKAQKFSTLPSTTYGMATAE